MSHVRYQVPNVIKKYIFIYTFSLKNYTNFFCTKKYKVVKIVGDRSVINEDTLSSLLKNVIAEQPGLQWVC